MQLALLLVAGGCAPATTSSVAEPKLLENHPINLIAFEEPSSLIDEQTVDLQKSVEPPEFPSFPDIDFFKAPTPPVVHGDLVDAQKDDHKTIRLIGFINLTNEEHRVALFKIDGQLVRLREGQQFEDLELLSVDQGTVTIQCDGHRSTLVLMEQPITNPPAQTYRRRPAKSSTNNHGTPFASKSPAELDFPIPSFPETPKPPPIPATPDVDVFREPSRPLPPQFPGLPSLEGFPDLTAP
ncbi:MAG: hypothetical protein KDB00_18780 [Planctomycetales bacterium]|nr:hypothetical protein [Planctomycetales bacterium]